MHFRILKMIATSGFLTALECTKFAPDPAGGAYSAPPDPLAGLRGALLLRGRGGEGTGEEGETKGRERKGRGRDRRGRGGGRERREGKGRRRDRPPLLEIPGSAPDWASCFVLLLFSCSLEY